MSKYDEQVTSNSAEYAKLPIPVNYVKWTNGDAKLSLYLQTDPALYLGGWTAQIEKRATKNSPAIQYPVMPFPIVEREGREEQYKVYSSCTLRYQHIATRTRYELRQRDEKNEVVKNEWGFPVVLATTKNFVAGSGYTPVKEILALVANKNGEVSTPILVALSGWGSWKSHNEAEKQYQRLAVPEGKLVLRCVGTQGKKNEQGQIKPVIEKIKNTNHTYNPIDAVHLDKVLYVDITPEFDELWNLAQAWANCPAWNAERGNKSAPAPVQEIVPSANAVYLDEEPNPFGLEEI